MIRIVVFAALIFCLTYLVYIYPFEIFAHLFIGSQIATLDSALLTAVIALIVVSYLRTHMSQKWLASIIHYGMGFGFIALIFAHLGWLGAWAAPQLSFEIALISFICFICLSAIAIYNGQHVAVKSLTFKSDKIKQATKWVFISDVHLGSNAPSHLAKLCEMIGKLDYDVLLIGGDLFDSSSFKPDDLSALTTITKPIYFVTGNHEYYVKDAPQKLQSLADYHIQTLDNEATNVHGIQLIGIDDKYPLQDQKTLSESLISDDKFNLIMVHQPALWHQLPKGTDLMLSGHTHNGQIFPFGWLVRLQFKAVYGVYHQARSSIYVSSGSGTWGPAMRLGTQNEIVHLTLATLAE